MFRNNSTNNEIEDMIKVIKSLKNRGILLKVTTTKIRSQKGEFLNFPRPLMMADLPLMKSALTPVAKSVLIPLGLSCRNVSSRCCYSNENLWIKLSFGLSLANNSTNNIKWRNGRYNEESELRIRIIWRIRINNKRNLWNN